MRPSARVSIKNGFLRVWLIVVFLTCFHGPAAAQSFELSLDAGRVAARQAALAGNFTLARDLALALLAADANDRTALIVLAAVQPQLGAPRNGRQAGVQAFRLSQTGDERYEAARLIALAAANEERYTLAQFWLRRAAINAPNDPALEQTRSDYRGVRNLNPWSANLEFSVTPSSNLNGGTNSDCLFFIPATDPDERPFCVGELSGASQELSGLVANADLRLAYAVSRSPVQRTTLTARANARSVWLSQDAREIVPDSSNSDFGSQILEFGVLHQRRLGDGTFSADAVSGLAWFGGDLGTNYYRTSLSYGTALSETIAATVSGEFQQTNIKGNSPHTNLRSTLSIGLSYVTQGGNRMSGQLSYDNNTSSRDNERFETLTAQFGYLLSDPIGPIQLSMTTGVAYSDYPDYSLPFTPTGRDDTRIFGSVTAVFHDIDYAGFVPVVTVGFQDAQSNVSRFERDEFSVNVGVRSSF